MFVTFEGPEGGGKSTAILTVAGMLTEEGLAVIVTREPGSGEFGKRIRAILLEGGEVAPRSELFLFLADRANHVETVVKPALLSGKVVLCDRHADSTLVYQGFVRGLDESFVRAGNHFATGGLVPDLTLLFDLPAEVGLSRITNKDRLDREPLVFHEAVREGFLKLSRQEPNRFVVLDATQPPSDLARQAFEHIRSCS